jgi:hypothetical protein
MERTNASKNSGRKQQRMVKRGRAAKISPHLDKTEAASGTMTGCWDDLERRKCSVPVIQVRARMEGTAGLSINIHCRACKQRNSQLATGDRARAWGVLIDSASRLVAEEQ